MKLMLLILCVLIGSANAEVPSKVKIAILDAAPIILQDDLDWRLTAFVSFMDDEEKSKWNYSSNDLWSRMKLHYVQLDNSPEKELIVEVQNTHKCGSLGCTGYVLKIDGESPKYLGEVFVSGSIVQPDIGNERLPESGFFDIVVGSRSGYVKYRYSKDAQEYKWSRF